MKEVVVYTDGACSGNPGPGGWAVILQYGPHTKELSGYIPDTTNNRMELFAALQGLLALKENCAVKLHSDSSYLINAFQKGWLKNWERNGWKTSTKKPVENQDLWRAILAETQRHSVEWVKVPGHQDNQLNNRCDEMARGQIKANRHLSVQEKAPAIEID